jgi:copper homeostasis protein
MVVEICVDSVESAIAAQQGGADRIELCSDLFEGGITPSLGLIGATREALTIPIFVMIRPRAGDFYYSASEFAVMKKDIVAAKAQGADGVVLGILTQNGAVDLERTRELVQLAGPMQVTFHRAFDRAPHMAEALEHVIASGAARILTSGGAQTAAQGAAIIARIVEQAHDRVAIMVGGSIRKENIAEIAHRTRAKEFHAALRTKLPSPVVRHNPELYLGEMGIDEFALYAVNSGDVRELRDAVHGSKEATHSGLATR